MQELLALEKGATEALLSLSLSHYTEDCGRGRLATAIAALYENVMPEDVIVLSGVDAVIHDTLSSLVEPGMNVMIQSPEYPPLLNVPQWRGATIKSWRPSGDGLDAGSGWDLALTVDAEAIVATVPHSPFGWSPSEEWYRALVKSADERGQLLVVDEIYRGIDLTADGHGVLPSACELSEQAVIFGGLAKSYGLTGLRVGRETGELETEHVEQIERAIRVSKQWLDAKLPARAKAELEEIEKFMTYKSEAGADFHLLLAKVAEANGEPAQARRVLQRVSKDAVSSSQRWQADQVLGSTGGAAPPSSPSQPNELGNLFQMPNQWGD